MTGRRKFSELVAKMPPERQARIEQMTEELREEMARGPRPLPASGAR